MTTYRIIEIVEQAIPDAATAKRRLATVRREKKLTGDRAKLIWWEVEDPSASRTAVERELRAIRESLNRIRAGLRR